MPPPAPAVEEEAAPEEVTEGFEGSQRTSEEAGKSSPGTGMEINRAGDEVSTSWETKEVGENGELLRLAADVYTLITNMAVPKYKASEQVGITFAHIQKASRMCENYSAEHPGDPGHHDHVVLWAHRAKVVKEKTVLSHQGQIPCLHLLEPQRYCALSSSTPCCFPSDEKGWHGKPAM